MIVAADQSEASTSRWLVALLGVVALAWFRPMSAQEITQPSVTATGGSVAIGGDASNATISIYNGVQDLSGLVAAFTAQVGAQTEARARAEAEAGRLGAELNLTREAVIGILQVAGEGEVAPGQLPLVLAQVTERYNAQLDRLASVETALATDNPAIEALVEQARAAIARFDFAAGDALLARAEEADLAAARQARTLADQADAAADARQLRAAGYRAERGEAARTQRRYAEAAGHFAEAAGLVPTGMTKFGWTISGARPMRSTPGRRARL